jgi:hypothetical protein
VAPEEQTRSIRLLRAISVNAKLAAQIAARWNFRAVCAFVGVYLADHAAGRCNGAGVLQTRCLAPDSSAPHLAASAPELTGVLLTQHITAADRTAWRTADETSQRQAEYERYAAAAEDYNRNRAACADPDPQPEPPPDTSQADFTDELRRRIKFGGLITAERMDGYVLLHAPEPEDRACLAEHHILTRNLAFKYFGSHTFQVVAA